MILMFVGFAGGLLAPVLLVAAWVLGSSTPIRTRVVQPALSKALSYEWGRKVLLQD